MYSSENELKLMNRLRKMLRLIKSFQSNDAKQITIYSWESRLRDLINYFSKSLSTSRSVRDLPQDSWFLISALLVRHTQKTRKKVEERSLSKRAKLIKSSHKHAGTSIHPCCRCFSPDGSCSQCGRPDASAGGTEWKQARSVSRRLGATLSGGGRRGRGSRSDTPPSAHRK